MSTQPSIEHWYEAFQLRRNFTGSIVALNIQNAGDRVVRFVKIRLELVEFPGEVAPLIESKQFDSLSDGKTLIFRGDASWAVYPKDTESFPLTIVAKRIALQLPGHYQELLNKLSWPVFGGQIPDELHYILLWDLIEFGTYAFRCTV